MPISRPGNNTAGFSLFEIIVVLILMGLAAALILPSFSGGLLGLELETAARDLVTHMRSIRSEAISQQEVFRIILQNGDGDAGAGYRLTNAYEKVLKQYPLPRGASFVFPESSSRLTVSFYPNGKSSGAEFKLRTQGGKELIIRVDPITGLAQVRKPGDENL